MEGKRIKRMLGKVYRLKLPVLMLVLIHLLQGCASSEISRTAAASADQAYIGIANNPSSVDIANSYQNTSQMTKGVLIGGITGGIIGGVTNGIGAIAGVATGSILGGALGAYIDAHSSLVDRLENRGVKVFVMGDEVMIVLFSNRLFYAPTSNLSAASTSTLDLVAQLIGNYANISVTVGAFTNMVGPEPVNRELSQQQATKVAKQLWRAGVNTRLLYAVGYGDSHLVEKNNFQWDSENNRVEIRLEKLPV